MTEDGKILYSELSYALNGICFEVHNDLGRSVNEQQVCDAIEQKLLQRKMTYAREKILPPLFAGEKPGRHRIDFLVENVIISDGICRFALSICI